MKSIIVILCFSLMHVLSAKEHGEELSGWRKLEQRGDLLRMRLEDSKVLNSTNLIYLKNGIDELNGWMREVITYSIPTNDMVRYADMLRVKTMLLYLTAWRMDSRKSWDELAKFLADVKSKKLPKSSERREELRKQFRMENGSLDIGPYREQLHKESCYQSALNQTELKITRAFYHILRNLPKEREGELIPILSEVLGADFVMQLKEMVGKK